MGNKLPIELELVSESELPEKTQKYFDICREKLGLVPNVLLSYSHDVAALDSFTQMYNQLMLGESGLSKLEREMIAVAVSSENDCHYCQVAHGAALRELSGDPIKSETVMMNYRAAELSQRERAMLDFAILMTKASATIEEADRQKLRDAGFTDRDIWDIASVASFYNMSNRMSSAVGMRPNSEYYGSAR